MKKILLAAVVVLTTGIITIVTHNNDVKAIKADKIVFAFEKQVTATAD